MLYTSSYYRWGVTKLRPPKIVAVLLHPVMTHLGGKKVIALYVGGETAAAIIAEIQLMHHEPSMEEMSSLMLHLRCTLMENILAKTRLW